MTRLLRAPWPTAVLSVALVALLSAPWYDLDQPTEPVGGPTLQLITSEYVMDPITGWQASTAVAILIAAVALVGVVAAFVPRLARVGRLAAAAGTGVILARCLWPPDELVMPVWGAWASLGVALLLTVAGVLRTRAVSGPSSV